MLERPLEETLMPERIPDIMEENREQGRRIASLEALVQDLTQRVMMLESECIVYDELLKLAKNVDDAFGEVADNLKKAKFTVYDSSWRRKKGD